MADSGSRAENGTGPGGRTGGKLRVFAQHLLKDFRGGISQTIRSEGHDGFAVLAILHYTSCTARLALLILWEEADADNSLRLERDWPSSRALDQRATKSPSDHLWRRDLTRCRISRQRRRCPIAGLSNTHFGSMKSLDH